MNFLPNIAMLSDVNGPSTRGVRRPIGDVVGISSVVGMFGPSVGSGGRCHFEGVREAALGQLDFEAVLALGLGVAQGGVRRLSIIRLVRRLTDECGFGLG